MPGTKCKQRITWVLAEKSAVVDRPQTDPHSAYGGDKFWTKDVVFTPITLNYSIKNNIGKFRMLSCTVIQLIYSLPLSVVSYLMTLLPGLLSYCVPVPVHLTKPLLLSPMTSSSYSFIKTKQKNTTLKLILKYLDKCPWGCLKPLIISLNPWRLYLASCASFMSNFIKKSVYAVFIIRKSHPKLIYHVSISWKWGPSRIPDFL